MNRYIILILIVALFPLIQAEKYTSRWDNIDVDEILHSDRLLLNYKKCLMDKGKCTADGTELKKRLPDALKTECSKCTEKQKENTEKIIDYMIENKKQWWDELENKYDPSGIYYNRYLEKKKSKSQQSSDDKQQQPSNEKQQKPGNDKEQQSTNDKQQPSNDKQ